MDQQDRYRELEQPSHTGTWNGELLKRAAEAATWQSDDRKSGWLDGILDGILYEMLRTVRERAKGRTTDQRAHNRPASTDSANYVTFPGDHDPAEKALAAIERVIRTIGNEYLQGAALALLAELRAELGEFDTAEGMAYAIPSPEPRARALAAIGRIQIRAGSIERASELLKATEDTAELLENSEDQAWMLENVVLIWADAEEWERAQSTLLKISAEEPDAKATAYQELAERLLRSNRSEEATSILSKAASIGSMIPRPIPRAIALSDIARLLYSAGHPERAKSLWEEAVAIAKLGQSSSDLQDALDCAKILLAIAEDQASAHELDLARQTAQAIEHDVVRDQALRTVDELGHAEGS